ncbi:MAG: ParA family protein [Natronospirillum sp.]
MKVLACYSIKGGVGKSATAVNLAWLAQRAGIQTLLIDLDPQGAASYYLQRDDQATFTATHWLAESPPLMQHIVSTDYSWLDILPAHHSLGELDRGLAAGSPKALRRPIRDLKRTYQLIIIDCPPTLTHLSGALFRAAHRVLVPVVPTTLSLRTFSQLEEALKAQQVKASKILPFFSMVQARRSMHRQIMIDFRKTVPATLDATIPLAADVEKMGLERAPVGVFAHRRVAARGYEHLWRELLTQTAI